MDRTRSVKGAEYEVRVSAGPVSLAGNLEVPAGARGVVLFAHGSGSDRHSPRNRFVARQLRDAGVATLLVDLLTEEEEAADRHTGHLRFDIGLLAERLVGATDWLAEDARTAGLSVGYFGAGTGGGAALVAAARRADRVGLGQLGAPVKQLVIVPGAPHLFGEPGKLEEVARLAADWFGRHLDLRAELKADGT
jgi:putative phosphoribosyl transferase